MHFCWRVLIGETWDLDKILAIKTAIVSFTRRCAWSCVKRALLIPTIMPENMDVEAHFNAIAKAMLYSHGTTDAERWEALKNVVSANLILSRNRLIEFQNRSGSTPSVELAECLTFIHWLGQQHFLAQLYDRKVASSYPQQPQDNSLSQEPETVQQSQATQRPPSHDERTDSRNPNGTWTLQESATSNVVAHSKRLNELRFLRWIERWSWYGSWRC